MLRSHAYEKESRHRQIPAQASRIYPCRRHAGLGMQIELAQARGRERASSINFRIHGANAFYDATNAMAESRGTQRRSVSRISARTIARTRARTHIFGKIGEIDNATGIAPMFTGCGENLRKC